MRVRSYREAFPPYRRDLGTSEGAMVRLREFEDMINLLAAQSALGEIVTRLIRPVHLRVGVQRAQGLVPSYECSDLPSAIYLQFYPARYQEQSAPLLREPRLWRTLFSHQEQSTPLPWRFLPFKCPLSPQRRH
jgi:hypothetical protein